MKILQFKYHTSMFFLVIGLLQNLLGLVLPATAQLFLSTPTDGVQCYGDPITLVCTHPVLPQEPEYLRGDVGWRRDGIGIPVGGLRPSEHNSTTTRLQFTITEDTVGNYTCLLVNAVRGGIVESNSVPVRPLDPTPPHITTIHSMETSIAVRWTPQPCNYTVRYSVSWTYTNDDGTTTTGSGVSDQVTNYTIPTSVQGVYTVSVQAVDGVGDVGPATSEVVRSTYPRPTADAPPCEDRSLVLTCLVGGLHNDTRSHFIWMDRNGPLKNSDQYSITGDQLIIDSISTISGEEHKSIRCCEVLSNGIVVTGEVYKLKALAQPGPPEVTITTTGSTITLTWNTTLRCFESEMFRFIVIWNEIGSGTSTNVTTSSSPYTISGLQPGTSYQISVQGEGGSGVVGGTTVLNVTTSAETPTGGGDPTTAIAVVIAVVVLVIIVTVALLICYVVPRCWKKRDGDYYTGSSVHTGKMSPEYSKTNVYGNILNELEHSQHKTVAAPSQGSVESTQVAQSPPPAVPPPYKSSSERDDKEFSRQDSNKSDEFKTQVVTLLQKVKTVRAPVNSGQNVLGNYKKTSFVAIIVYVKDESQDVSDRDIERVATAKSRHRTDKGLLVSNVESIPGSLMEKLEKKGCHFIGLHPSDTEEVTEDLVMKKLDLFFI